MQCAWRALHDKNYNYKDNCQYAYIVKQVRLTQADGEVRKYRNRGEWYRF